MIIYATPYKAETRNYTGYSVDSGFRSIEEARAAMGTPVNKDCKHMLIYGDNKERVMFSKTPFNLPEKDDDADK